MSLGTKPVVSTPKQRIGPRQELAHVEEEKMNLEDSFIRGDGLSKLCNQWAELQTLSSSCTFMEKKIENANKLSKELDEIKAQLKKKVAADRVLCEMLDLEEEKIEASVEVYTRVTTMVAQLAESTRKRIEVMDTNAQDYDNYRSLPIEDRFDFIKCLAAMLGSDTKGVKQAIISLDENSKNQHQSLLEYYKKFMQTIISVEHKMKDCYFKDIQEHRKPQNGSNLPLYKSIQSMLGEMTVEIANAVKCCQVMQDNGPIAVEDIKMLEVLRSIVLHYNN